RAASALPGEPGLRCRPGHHHHIRTRRGHRLTADRHRERDHRPESEVLMATAATPVAGADNRATGRSRSRRILRGIAQPFRDSHGVGRFMLVTGSVLVAVMAVMAIFAPVI